MGNDMNADKRNDYSVPINGIVVHLIFAPKGNAEVIAVVKDILKTAYLQSRNV